MMVSRCQYTIKCVDIHLNILRYIYTSRSIKLTGNLFVRLYLSVLLNRISIFPTAAVYINTVIPYRYCRYIVAVGFSFSIEYVYYIELPVNVNQYK